MTVKSTTFSTSYVRSNTINAGKTLSKTSTLLDQV